MEPKAILEKYRPDLTPFETLYKTLHQNPGLSLQEHLASTTAATHLRTLPSFTIRNSIGGTGLIGFLTNGPGPTVLLRADTDALPVKELTGLPYASEKTEVDVEDGVEKPVMHACGHDMHVACMLAATTTLSEARDEWRGTLVVLFQPNEERGAGARAMVEDGLYDMERHGCPVPDVVLGQHVMPFAAGEVGTRVGNFASAADSFKVEVFGRGGHASQPRTHPFSIGLVDHTRTWILHQKRVLGFGWSWMNESLILEFGVPRADHCEDRTIDPVVLASHIVVRLQTVVSREVDPREAAVVTVGSIQAGQTENIIASSAILKLNIRTTSPTTRTRVLSAIKRIVSAECDASGSPQPPSWHPTSSFPFTINDAETTEKVSTSFNDYFGEKHNPNSGHLGGSEDFAILATEAPNPKAEGGRGVPYCYWIFGGVDPETWKEKESEGKLDEIPINHSAYFAPAVQPTLKTGVDALVVGALAFLGRPGKG
ncbi:hypothetical protein ONS96_002452 [Cadophora gregata f. sp. sojae]|nr:hypothetical protein ONS96_002452 [Cadophora gregata f. sp. sojae]